MLRGSNYSNGLFFFSNVFILFVCSALCVYSLVYILNIAIPWSDALSRIESSAGSYDSAFGFQTGVLSFLH